MENAQMTDHVKSRILNRCKLELYQLKVNRLDRADYSTSSLNCFSIITYSSLTCGFRVDSPTHLLVRRLCQEQVIPPPRYAQVRSTGHSTARQPPEQGRGFAGKLLKFQLVIIRAFHCDNLS